MDIEFKKLKQIKDSRGVIVELLRRAQLDDMSFGHLFYVTFKNKKAIRGNHYHKRTHEYYFVLQGKISVELVDVKTKEKRKIIMDKKDGKLLRIGPYMAHASKSYSQNTILLAYDTLPYNIRNPDTFRYLILK